MKRFNLLTLSLTGPKLKKKNSKWWFSINDAASSKSASLKGSSKFRPSMTQKHLSVNSNLKQSLT